LKRKIQLSQEFPSSQQNRNQFDIYHFIARSMNLQPGQWIKCFHTQEKGKILPYEGRAICISLGDGITLYVSPESLEALGWQLLREG
jgi:hypothetical protein